jgi:hypothetical protein
MVLIITLALNNIGENVAKRASYLSPWKYEE